MKEALFVCHDAGGTIPPVLAVAEAMLDEGHRVTVLGQPSVQARAERIGARFRAFTTLPDYDRHRTLEDQLERIVPAVSGHGTGDDLRLVADEVGADVVAVDPNLAGALAAGQAGDRPSAVLLHSVSRTFVDVWCGELWPLLADPINATRAGFGLDPATSWASLFEGHDAVIAPAPAVFDEGAIPGLRHHGFLVPSPRGEAVADRPDVLVALSTTYQRHEALLGTIVEALGRLPLRALVTTGGHVAVDIAGGCPDNVELVDHVDHASIMATTRVVVTHAGLGTVAVALAAGVPLVCTPIDRDQPLNAERVAALGAGVVVDPATATPDAIATAVESVLADGAPYGPAAEAVADASRKEGGAAGAARAILDLTA